MREIGIKVAGLRKGEGRTRQSGLWIQSEISREVNVESASGRRSHRSRESSFQVSYVKKRDKRFSKFQSHPDTVLFNGILSSLILRLFHCLKYRVGSCNVKLSHFSQRCFFRTRNTIFRRKCRLPYTLIFHPFYRYLYV